MKKWEYKFIVDLHSPKKPIHSEKEFEKLGKEGWELVTIYTIPSSGGTTATTAIFKKELK